MPRRCDTHPHLPALLRGCDWVVDRDMAQAWGLTPDAVRHRLRSGQWRELLPGVWLAHAGEPHRRQLLSAALLWAGENSAIDAADACRYYGIRALGVAERDPVQVLTRHGDAARSFRFVKVRRTVFPFQATGGDRLRWVPPEVAIVAATRTLRSPRTVLAVASDGIQRRIVSYDALLRAHLQGPPRGAVLLDRALADLAPGTHSVGEADFHRIVGASSVLPPPIYNAWILLPGGQQLCLDALWEDAGLVHEVNGRKAHARADLFDDTMARQTLLTTAGLTVLANSGRRIRDRPRLVLSQVETCYLRHRGQGLPPGVIRIPPPDMAA
jgi:hypothetical protein